MKAKGLIMVAITLLIVGCSCNEENQEKKETIVFLQYALCRGLSDLNVVPTAVVALFVLLLYFPLFQDFILQVKFFL